MRNLLFIGLCCFAAAITGCKDQRILEDLSMINAVGIDSSKEKQKGAEQILLTVNFLEIDPDAKKQMGMLSSTGTTIKEARINLSRQTSHYLASGQMRTVLIGQNLARTGIWKHLDTLYRDPAIGQRVWVTVVDGRASDLITANYAQKTLLGITISELIETGRKNHSIPNVNLSHFARDYWDDGIDPVAPIITKGQNRIRTNGIALFKDDRYVARIPPEKGLIFDMLRDNVKGGELFLALGGKEEREWVMIDAIVSNRNISVKRLHPILPRFEVDIQQEIKGNLLEYIGPHSPDTKEEQAKLEKKIAQHIKRQNDELLAFMQKKHADGAGIGQYVRNSMSYQDWKKLDWNEVYPKVKINTRVKVKIKAYGKID